MLIFSVILRQILRVKDADKVPMVICGNKSDLERDRQVTAVEGRDLAKSYGTPFFETSAKTSAGVEETFTTAAKTIYQGIQEDKYDTEGEAIGIKAGNM